MSPNWQIRRPDWAFHGKTVCPTCLEPLEIGDYPFCPHGKGFTRINPDECDYIDHNLAQHPIRIRSWSQRRALMAAAGLQDFQYDVPVPDDATPNSQRPSRWGAYRLCDPEYLAWLAEKLSTGKPAKETEDPIKVRITTGKGIPEGFDGR